MKAPSTLSIPWTLNWLVCCFTFFPFVWLVMACVTTPISTKLRMSRLVDGNGDVLDFGVFGACANGLSGDHYTIDGADCSTQKLGYKVLASSANTGPMAEVELLTRDDTYPMVLIPIATGFTGYSTLLLLIAWLGGGRKWARSLDMSNMGFHWACTIITWIAFGFCIRLTLVLRGRLDVFIVAGLTPQAQFGNAVWLTLVAALLMLIGSVLYTVKQFWRPAKVEPRSGKSEQDVEMDGKKSPRQQPYVGMIGG